MATGKVTRLSAASTTPSDPLNARASVITTIQAIIEAHDIGVTKCNIIQPSLVVKG
jgi:hypothetical protein